MKLTEEIGTALLNYDLERLNEIATEDYRVDLTAIDAIRLCDRASRLFCVRIHKGRQLIEDQADWGGWIVWFKREIGNLIPHGWNKLADVYHVTAILHTWFLWLEETDEMYVNLRGSDAAKRIDPAPARSRITDYQSQLKPINVVAARVGPPEFLEGNQ